MKKRLINSRKRDKFEQLEIEEMCIYAYHNSRKITRSVIIINKDMGYLEKPEDGNQPKPNKHSTDKILTLSEFRRIIKKYKKDTKKHVLDQRDEHEPIQSMQIRLQAIKIDIKKISDATDSVSINDHSSGYAALFKTKLEYVAAEQQLEEEIDLAIKELKSDG